VKNNNKLKHYNYKTKFVKSNGFKCQIHEFDTKDGYILTTHRVLPKTRNKSMPVLMLHGIFASSGDFIVSGKESPGLFLANNGYDVWVGNVRGNRYSLKHKNMTIKDSKFWDFSFHEIGLFDVRAMIDNILKITKSKKLIYIGHSQGGVSALVLLSLYPEYNQKISQLHLISPAVFWGNFRDQNVKNYVLPILSNIFKTVNVYDQFVNDNFFKSVLNYIFESYEKNKTENCKNAAPLICGDNFDCNREYAHTYVTLFFSRTVSIKQFVHFFQQILSNRFCQFDYYEKNYKIYGTSEPPDYNLNNVLTKTYIYAADDADKVVSLKDVKKLRKVLKNVKSFKILNRYNHCDLIYGQNVRNDYFEELLKTINEEISFK
jgi:lysosomal acid lipase/cholesteryl ester hydrolase